MFNENFKTSTIVFIFKDIDVAGGVFGYGLFGDEQLYSFSKNSLFLVAIGGNEFKKIRSFTLGELGPITCVSANVPKVSIKCKNKILVF